MKSTTANKMLVGGLLAAWAAGGCGGGSKGADTSGAAASGGAGVTGGAGATGSAGNHEPPPPVSSTIAMAAQTCATEPLPTTGTIYYACDCGPNADADCKPGDDTAAGTDPSKPWRTYDKLQAQFAKLAAGDTLAFCKGGSFAESKAFWSNKACQAANPCTVRDYTPPWASGDEKAPKLVGGTLNLENAAMATHEEGYRFLNLELDGPGMNDGIFVYNDLKDVLICNVEITNYTTAINVQGSNKPADASSDGKNARIIVRGSRLHDNVGFGWLGACDGCGAEYSYFDHNGQNNEFDHNIYFSGIADGNGVNYVAKNMRAVGNELYHAAQGSTTVCEGIALVAHGMHDGLLIQGNKIIHELGQSAPGCWGIGVVPGYGGQAESFTNVSIVGNTVVNVGNESIYVASCKDCVIEDNLVIQAQTGFGSNGIGAHPDGKRDADDQPMDSVQILNNTIYFGADMPSTGITLGGEGTNHVLAGNAISGVGSKQWSCLSLDLATSAYYSDHNLCWDSKDPNGQWVSGVGDLAAWQAKSNLDLHSLDADPMFTMASDANYDFMPATGSPLLGAGDPTHGATIDIAGNARPTTPDIGAYQH